MSMWTAIALIAIASIAASAWRRCGSNKEDTAVKELYERVNTVEQNLGERIETLERIVTDSKEDLKRQFDHLDRTG